MKILYFIQDILYAMKIVYYNLFFVHLFLNLKTTGKDTLHIGTIQEFKKKYPEIINLLLQDDSIQFWIYTPWSKDNGNHFILPIEQK
mgnify:CR=1 FL=1